MFKKRGLHFLEAIATLSGTIIGAGIFGIPYVIQKAGFLTGLLNLAVLGVVVILLYLYLGEITLRTKGIHQLTGYAEKYLGKIGKHFMSIPMVVGIYGAMVAYIIGSGQALSALFSGDQMKYSIIFFVVISILIYLGLEAIEKCELFMEFFNAIIITILIVLAFTHINMANVGSFNIAKFFVPYGVILFALMGASSIPEVRQELKGNEKSMKRALLIGILIPIVIYAIFAFITIGVTGSGTTEVATIGLGNVLGEKVLIFGNIFAVLTMATSALALGLALLWMFHYDYKLDKTLSWILTCFIPMFIVLLNVTSFIKAIGIAGVIAGGFEGVLIVLMAYKAKKHGERKPEYSVPVNHVLSAILIALFTFGAIYYFMHM